MNVKENIQTGEYLNRIRYSAQSKTLYWSESKRIRETFREDLARTFDVYGNPKEEKLFEAAWDLGHASGLHQVYDYYEMLSPLIK